MATNDPHVFSKKMGYEMLVAAQTEGGGNCASFVRDCTTVADEQVMGC